MQLNVKPTTPDSKYWITSSDENPALVLDQPGPIPLKSVLQWIQDPDFCGTVRAEIVRVVKTNETVPVFPEHGIVSDPVCNVVVEVSDDAVDLYITMIISEGRYNVVRVLPN